MKIYVVIPNWNGRDFIGKALKSLEAQTQAAHIIVVDNGSADGSADYIAEHFPKVELLRFDDNAGFSGGVNRGIQPAIDSGAEFVALFNNDAMADKNWLKHLVTAAQAHPETGIITGKLLRTDKKHIDSTGDFYSTHAMPFPRGRNQADTGQYDTAEYVFGGSGGASLYRSKMLSQIGLFDTDYFAYFEDVDISFRAQLAGWKVWYEPQATAYHMVSATSSKLGSFSRYHSIKNFILLYNKNMPGFLFWRYKLWFFIGLARMFLGALRDGFPLIFFKALIKGILLLPSTLRKRHHIQRSRTVTPAYIRSILHAGSPPRIPKL